MSSKVINKLNAIQQTFSNTDEKPINQQMPEYTKKIKTLNSIPKHLHQAFPSKLAFMVDQTLAERETNPSHERMQKIQFKREIENSI